MATVDGRAFGHWRLERAEDRLLVVIEPFEPPPRGAPTGIEAEVADIGRFLGAEAAAEIERPA